MCVPLTMDGASQRIFAANIAEFRKNTMSPFGKDDEIGMLNHVTPETMRTAAANADMGFAIDMSVDYFVGMPSFTAAGQPDYQIWMTNTPRGTVLDDPMNLSDRAQNELVAYSGDAISMYTHTGTHIDTLNHFGYHGGIWNGFQADEHLGNRVWNVCGPEKHPPLVARGVMIDIAGLLGVDVLPHSYAITPKDIQDALKRQKVELRPGDVVMIRTGQMSLWPTPDYIVNEGGITRETAEFLAKAGAVVIGADNLSLEQIPSTEEGNWLPVHTYLLAEAGVHIMEVVDLEGLAREQISEFCYVGASIKFTGATAAPIRPIAFPMKDR